jgi:hypothetical protein
VAVSNLLHWDAIWAFLALAVCVVGAVGAFIIGRQDRDARGLDDPTTLRLSR